VQDEQKRQQQEEADRKRREADTAHRAKINNEILHDIVGLFAIEDEQAKAIITAIAQGKSATLKSLTEGAKPMHAVSIRQKKHHFNH